MNTKSTRQIPDEDAGHGAGMIDFPETIAEPVDIVAVDIVFDPVSNESFPLAGTVIHGTHRLQDLIPAFIDVLEKLAPDAHAQLMMQPFGPVPAYVMDEGDDAAWWESTDALYLLEQLHDTLNEHAPDGWYFGSHPGDGSDYGFWEQEE